MTNLITDSDELKTHVLEKFKHYSEILINPRELQQLDYRLEDNYYGQLLLRIKHEFFGEKITAKVSIDFTYEKYSSFWQHFKADYFPQFLLRIFPIKTIKITETKEKEIDRTFYFPNAYVQNHPQLSNFIIQDFLK